MKGHDTMKTIYSRPKALLDVPNAFCPGCNHSTIMRLIAEVLEEMDLLQKAIAAVGIGCGGMLGYFLDCDTVSALHGRAPAVATGIKRVRPDNLVFAYQGDGDLASIGMAETIHAANRGEKITIVFINNIIFGMTGGQMAPTTLIGQNTTTTPDGRNAELHGYPIRVCELIDQLDAPAYIARFAVNTPSNIIKAKAGLKKAFEIQMAGKGYSFVEILAACPTGWGLMPLNSLTAVGEKMMKYFSLGVLRSPEEGE